MSVEQFRKDEATVDFVVALDAMEDIQLIETGYGGHVDLYESNRFHLEIANMVYGFKEGGYGRSDRK